MTVETRRVWTRANVLPLAAGTFLLAGAACWLWARLGNRPNAGAIRDGVWYAGLLLTGVPVVVRTLMQAARGHLATDLVAALAVGGSVALGEPLAGLVIVLMQTGGEALERYAEGRASGAIRALIAAAPTLAHRLTGEHIEDVPADDVNVGDLLVLRGGELLACDAVVEEGQSELDISRLTGEPLPLSAGPGTPLMSGSANGQ